MQLYLNELYRVIRQLMDATFEAQDQRLKVMLAKLEYKARICKQMIEEWLGLRN